MRPIHRRIAAVLSACALLGAGCSGSPSGPTTADARTQQGVLDATRTLNGAQFAAQAEHLTPDHFAAHGWDCRPTPVPNRVACSPPHQGFPTIPPPDDRPASFTFLAWESGIFAGRVTLLRTDLYSGQTCDSTGEPYAFRERIGYYECLHRTGS
jgi:hypothetical protein